MPQIILIGCELCFLHKFVDCHISSRCKRDSNYEPSRIVITNGKAKNMLENVIRKSTIYQHPQDYILGKDTFYVESFNNVMNIFFPFCVAGALGLLDFQIEVYPLSTFSIQWHTARSERNLYCSSPKQILQ
jgi:hypothetical protein